MLEEDTIAVEKFREYVRIPSVQPDVDYDECLNYLKQYSKELELPIEIYSCYEDKPIAIITWLGKDPDLPSIVLNSHMDVVPVSKDKWTYNPFGAEMDDNGNIYGRGTQDTKNLGVQYLEAIRRLKSIGTKLLRTIHVLFVPDEEIGGYLGMKAFVNTDKFKNLNVGFALDEGHSSMTDEYLYFNGERCAWQMMIHCDGTSGHGATMPLNSAGTKVSCILNKIQEFREKEILKLDKVNPDLSLGELTSINVTMLQGGQQINVLPSRLTVGVDVRIAVTVDLEKLESNLNKWCEEAGEGVHIDYIQKSSHTPVTPVDETNMYWVAFKRALDNRNLKSKRKTMPGATDARYMRLVGVPALGFSPIVNLPVLAHADNEYLNVDNFLNGIKILYDVILEIANVPKT